MAVKFSFKLEVDPCKDPNKVGEYLRTEFFTEDCCLSVRDDVVSLGEEVTKEDDDYEISWNKYIKKVQGYDIMMRCAVDGDTFIEFHFSDKSVLLNSDAKKSHWVYYPNDSSSIPWV